MFVCLFVSLFVCLLVGWFICLVRWLKGWLVINNVVQTVISVVLNSSSLQNY